MGPQMEMDLHLKNEKREHILEFVIQIITVEKRRGRLEKKELVDTRRTET